MHFSSPKIVRIIQLVGNKISVGFPPRPRSFHPVEITFSHLSKSLQLTELTERLREVLKLGGEVGDSELACMAVLDRLCMHRCSRAWTTLNMLNIRVIIYIKTGVILDRDSHVPCVTVFPCHQSSK